MTETRSVKEIFSDFELQNMLFSWENLLNLLKTMR